MAKWQGHCCRADELNFHCSWQLLVVGASFLFLVTFSWVPCEADDLNSDAAALLAFYDGLRSAQKVTWDVKQSPCNWQGVFCSPNKDRVWLLRIPASELYGQIRPGSLGHLSALRVLSLRSNYLFGPLPTDLANCTQLRSLFLQDNALMGPLPSFQPSRLLTRIDLSFNKFNGSIADSLNSLPNLRVLYLQNNAFSGQIPDLRLHDLRQFSVANNKLTGSIPTSLQKFSCTAFSGNPLCGAAQLSPCFKIPAPLASPPIFADQIVERRILTSSYIAVIVVALFLLIFLISTLGALGLFRGGIGFRH
eukprot:c12730_g1_i2 orf=452-1369(-)